MIRIYSHVTFPSRHGFRYNKKNKKKNQSGALHLDDSRATTDRCRELLHVKAHRYCICYFKASTNHANYIFTRPLQKLSTTIKLYIVYGDINESVQNAVFAS